MEDLKTSNILGKVDVNYNINKRVNLKPSK